MITKTCPTCGMDIPLGASKCPYCHTKQPIPTNTELKGLAIIEFVASIVFFIVSIYFYQHSPSTFGTIFLPLSFIGVGIIIFILAVQTWKNK